MRAYYGYFRAVLSWMALFFADDARWDLSRFSNSFHIFPLDLFGWGGVGAGAVASFCGLGGG